MSISPFLQGWLAGNGAHRRGTFVAAEIVKITGGNGNAAIILSQILYWNAPTAKRECKIATYRHGKYWLAKRYEDWEEETGINEYTARNGVKRLKSQGLIETKVMKWAGNPTVHIALCRDALERKLGELHTEPNDQLGRNQETTNQVETKIPIKSLPLTETTHKDYTHTLEPQFTEVAVIDSANAGVCKTSLEAPLGERPEVTVSTDQKREEILRPIPKVERPSLDGVADYLKKLGVKSSNVLKSAAHDLSNDELTSACMALEEGLEAGAVQSRQAYLVSAFKNRYEPSESWVKSKEADRLKAEARETEKQREADELRLKRKRVASMMQTLEAMEANDEIKVEWDKSDFKVNGEYWYSFPQYPKLGVFRSDPENTPRTAESIIRVKSQIREMEARLNHNSSPVPVTPPAVGLNVEVPDDVPF